MKQRFNKPYLKIELHTPKVLISLYFVILAGCSPMNEERQLITSRLKDPESTKFRNEKRHKTGYVCGEFNSKNSYGAYTGYIRYVAKGPDISYTEDGSSGKLEIEDFQLLIDDIRNKEKTGFGKIWNKYCQ